MLGLHWIADLAGCTPSRLTAEVIRDFLVQVPANLGLRRIGEPQLFSHHDAGRPSSVAGIVLLAESHLSVHGFPDTGSAHVDLFSCRALNADLIRAAVVDALGARSIDETIVERGRQTSHRLVTK